MGIAALITGILGGLCGIWGILDAFDVIPADTIDLTVDWTFWFPMAVILMLAAILFSVNNKGEVD